ncbi:MAG: hypothetical protein JNM17_29770 [Archangium sp.]|nr:hypothetical protein [Archangium sp.]
MKRLMFALTVLAGLALAQGKPVPPKVTTTAVDAGVPPKPSADAGVAQEPLRVPGNATTADVERARKEIAELRVKVADLETRLTKAEGLSRDVDALRTRAEKLEARLDAEDERREAEEREVQRKKTVAAQNNQMLTGALQQLSTGNTTNIDAWLRSVESNTTGNVQKWVQLARQSLAQQDLVTARQYLVLALAEP